MFTMPMNGDSRRTFVGRMRDSLRVLFLLLLRVRSCVALPKSKIDSGSFSSSASVVNCTWGTARIASSRKSLGAQPVMYIGTPGYVLDALRKSFMAPALPLTVQTLRKNASGISERCSTGSEDSSRFASFAECSAFVVRAEFICSKFAGVLDAEFAALCVAPETRMRLRTFAKGRVQFFHRRRSLRHSLGLKRLSSCEFFQRDAGIIVR